MPHEDSILMFFIDVPTLRLGLVYFYAIERIVANVTEAMVSIRYTEDVPRTTSKLANVP